MDNTTELWMTKYIIGDIFNSGGATLYKNPSDQTVTSCFLNSDFTKFLLLQKIFTSEFTEGQKIQKKVQNMGS